MKQTERIMQYIGEFGSITSMEAFADLGITRLAARISDLEDNGVVFRRQTESTKNRYGEKVHYTRYSVSE